MKMTEYQIIHHPSHPHLLVPLSKPNMRECDACGKEQKGIFYLCATCFGLFIHRDCAFLPTKLLIQETTNRIFTHPLTLSYSFPLLDRHEKFYPSCRVCNETFSTEN